jgi:hypothetical protein
MYVYRRTVLGTNSRYVRLKTYKKTKQKNNHLLEFCYWAYIEAKHWPKRAVFLFSTQVYPQAVYNRSNIEFIYVWFRIMGE